MGHFLQDNQGCHVSGKCQGKTKFSPGSGKNQGILKKCQGILAISPMSGNCQGIL